jgi:hypothetical protein
MVMLGVPAWRIFLSKELGFMKRFLFALAVVVPVLALLGAGRGKGRVVMTDGTMYVEQTVLVPHDMAPFQAEMKQLVRLPGDGISGSKTVAAVDGPAKIVAANVLMNLKGGHPLIGMLNKEFIVKPLGKGKVKVKITSTPPQPDAKPAVVNYEFEVK